MVDLTADIEEERLLESMDLIFCKKGEIGLKKISENYRKILCGFLVCSQFNLKN